MLGKFLLLLRALVLFATDLCLNTANLIGAGHLPNTLVSCRLSDIFQFLVLLGQLKGKGVKVTLPLFGLHLDHLLKFLKPHGLELFRSGRAHLEFFWLHNILHLAVTGELNYK